LCGEIQSIHRFEKCSKCSEDSFELSTEKVKVLPDAIQTKWVCIYCTLTNKLDFNNLNSAICLACETEDKNIFKQIEAALRSKSAPEEKWKCVNCKTINAVEWNDVSSSICNECC
jgi:hypothetical protein